MDPKELTPDQILDINDRVAKAKKALEDLQLQPTASVQSVNVGDDIFSQKVVIYLQDTKFLSPIKKKDVV